MKNSFILVTAITIIPMMGVSGQKAGKATESAPVIHAKAADVNSNLEAAKAAFVKKDKKTAVAKINAARALVDKQAEAANPKNRKPLADASEKLGSLAERVKNGTVKDAKALDAAFASTHQSLAAYYQKKAAFSLEAGKKTVAGKSLAAAANHLETAGNWAGHKFTAGGKGTIKLMRETSGALVGAAGTVVEGTGDVLTKGVALINRLGTKITGADPDKKTLVGKAVEGTVTKGGKAVKKAGDAVKGKPSEKKKDEKKN